MVQAQIISKILNTGKDEIIDDNLLTREHFLGYENEFDFIEKHKERYGNIPDKETFLQHFPDFEILEVTESDKYLVDTIQEEYLYAKIVPVIQKSAEISNTDSNHAAEYLLSQMPSLQPNYHIGGTNIIANAHERFAEYEERKDKQKEWYFESGFQELDEIIHGLQRGEDFIVIVARLGEGKSWILTKMCAHVWKTGFNVGYFSPEMSANMVGFRVDTLLNNFSNKGLMWGNGDVDDEQYRQYVEDLKSRPNKFIVSTPLEFDRHVTVSKLRNWVKQNKLDMIAIDGIKYLSDERGRKNDNMTTSLTNISEDLMELSMEMHIPVIAVVQANRSGVGDKSEDGTPELESIRDSDGIAHNASKVISIKQKTGNILEMGIKKNRFGRVGGRLNYSWDINTGDFTFLDGDDGSSRRSRNASSESKSQPKSKTDVF